MFQVSFTAGYGDPSRTIAKKFKDFKSIETITQEANKTLRELQTKLVDLKNKKISLVKTYQNVNGANSENIKRELLAIDNLIQNCEENIENKKSSLINLYYGYHERL